MLATSWKPVKDATCPHRPPASWSVLLHVKSAHPNQKVLTNVWDLTWLVNLSQDIEQCPNQRVLTGRLSKMHRPLASWSVLLHRYQCQIKSNPTKKCTILEAFQRCTMSTGQWPAGLLHHSGSLRTRHDEPLIAVKIRNLDYVHDTTLIFIHLINIWWKSTKRRIFLLQEKYRILQEEKVCCCCILSGSLPSTTTRQNCFIFEAFDDTSRKKKE